MKIEYYKPISFLITSVAHAIIWYFNFLNKFTTDLMNELFSASITLIGFIFAVIAILVTITEHSLIKTMRQNGMYQQIMDHLKYLLTGFSITTISSYAAKLTEDKIFLILSFITSFIFMYSLLMLVTDMFKRLTLTFTNLAP